MTCADLVRLYLLSLASVSSLVGARIWTVRFPQSPTYPAVKIQNLDERQYPHLRGTADLKWAPIQIDIAAKTLEAAQAVDRAIQGDYVNGAATGLRGAVVTMGSPGFQICGATVLGYGEDYEGGEVKLYRVRRDYGVNFKD